MLLFLEYVPKVLAGEYLTHLWPQEILAVLGLYSVGEIVFEGSICSVFACGNR